MRLHSLNIVIDSNEKKPFIFPRQHKIRIHNLKPYGCDYSVWGYLDFIGVERKNYGDWATSITTGWKRFRKSLDKLARTRYRCIVIEKPMGWFYHKHGSVPEGVVIHKTAEIVAHGIPVIFCNSEIAAMQFTLAFLRFSIRKYKRRLERAEQTKLDPSTEKAIKNIRRSL